MPWGAVVLHRQEHGVRTGQLSHRGGDLGLVWPAPAGLSARAQVRSRCPIVESNILTHQRRQRSRPSTAAGRARMSVPGPAAIACCVWNRPGPRPAASASGICGRRCCCQPPPSSTNVPPSSRVAVVDTVTSDCPICSTAPRPGKPTGPAPKPASATSPKCCRPEPIPPTPPALAPPPSTTPRRRATRRTAVGIAAQLSARPCRDRAPPQRDPGQPRRRRRRAERAIELCSAWMFAYVDAALCLAEDVYTSERERWLRSAAASQAETIDTILSGQPDRHRSRKPAAAPRRAPGARGRHRLARNP